MYLPIERDMISNVTGDSVGVLSTKMYAFAGEHLSQGSCSSLPCMIIIQLTQCPTVLFIFFMLVCYVAAGCDRWFELRARDRERLRRELCVSIS
jgi:hypothetical protein